MGASSSPNSIRAGAARASAQAGYHMAAMDINIVNTKMRRDLNALSQEITRAGATQRSQAGSTGFAVGSKSFLAVMSDTTTAFERKADDIRTDAELQRQRIWYQAQVNAMEKENQARVAEAIDAQQRQQQMQGIFKQFGGMISRFK